jgi:diguanylate cyclase (GGDEF)-like protein
MCRRGPDVSLDPGPVPPTNSPMDMSGRAWKAYLGVGLALAIAQVMIDPERALSSYSFVAVAITGPIAMAVGIRRLARRGPWLLVLAGVTVMVAGDVLWVWYQLTGRDPFPSPADALYLPGYPLIAAGLLWMLHDNEAGSEHESLIDATIVATGSGVLSWMFLIAPFLRDTELTLAERAASAAYPLMGILLVAVVARLGFARRRARLSDVLIGTGLGALLIADTYLGVIELTVGYDFNPVAELLWLAMYVLLGAAALAPEPEADADAPPRVRDTAAATSRMRLPLLTVASLMAPGVLAWHALRGRSIDLLVIAAGSTLLFLLVLARLLGLLRRVEEQAAAVALLATSDPLTGLPNRRYWETEIRQVLARAARTGEPVSVAMIDLDHFKPFNDTRGHYAGDSLLRDASRAWREALRGTDVVARFGGDEFAVVLPACDVDAAEDAVERLRRATPGPHSFSCGLALWNGEETDEALMIRADMALYAAKAAGRGTTVRADTAAADPARTVCH